MKAPVATAGITESAKGGTPWIDVFELNLGAVNGDDWLIPWLWATGFAATDTVATFEFNGGAVDIAGVEGASVANNGDEVAIAGLGPFATMLDANGDSDWAASLDFGDDSFDCALESFAVNAGSARFGGWVAEATVAH